LALHRDPADDVVAVSPLHDTTLPWYPNVDRFWLRRRGRHHHPNDEEDPPPPAMLLLTEFGWNHPNQTMGRQVYRGMRTRELVEAIVNHPVVPPHGMEGHQCRENANFQYDCATTSF
jgi:hypothetical protein